MKPHIASIDPGLSGALCILSINPRKLLAIHDLPLIETKSKNEIDAISLATLIDLYAPTLKFAVIEKVSAMTYTDKHGETRGQGAAASFNFGKGFGIILGVLAAFQVPTHLISPSVWKSLLNLTSKKSDSISLAKKLYPSACPLITLKKHDGRAEALLLAHFAAERMCR